MKSRNILLKLARLMRAVVITALLIVSLPAAPVSATAIHLYVATTGNDAGNCQSELSPCKTVAYAISQAAGGEIINIAAGFGSARAALQPAPDLRSLPAPIHAWIFNTNANDSVGFTNVNMYYGAYISGCRLILDGGDDFGTLTSGIVSGLTDASFEVWVTQTAAGDMKRIFDFGTGYNAYMYLTPSESTTHYPRFSITTGGPGSEHIVSGSSAIPVGTQAHIVVTIDSTHMARLYVNGALVGGPTDVTLTPADLGSTSRNYLGMSSQYLSDRLTGGINELRMYNVVLSDAQVAESYASGPSLVNCSPAAITNVPTGVTSSAVVLNGMINPADLDTLSVSFEYGLDTSYGSSVAAVPASVSGFMNTPVSASLSELPNDSVYHFRVKAEGTTGTLYGNDQDLVIHTASIRYVKPSASGTGNCTSWENACALQTALNSAISGDELWVAAGTYKPTSGTDRTATFQLQNGVPVYGGFAGTETTRDDRSPLTNITLLSGDIGAGGTYTDNSYHVVTGAAGASLDGFTITAGNASNYSQYGNDGNGGAILNKSSTLTVSNLIISNNNGVLGPGIFNSGTLVVRDSTISGNVSSGGHGGGINNTGTLTVIGSTFTGNSGFYGGAIHNNSSSSSTCASASSATILNSTFSGNSAAGGGSGIYNNFGTITLLFNTITANNAGGVFSRNDNGTCTKAGSNIITGNTGYDVRSGYTDTRFYSLDYNLVGVAGMNVDFALEFNQPNDQVNVTDALLGALADNGGPTQTYALLQGSPAIDAGDDTACAAAPVSGLDQRGFTRPHGAHCDIGALELENKAPTDIALSNSSVAENQPVGTSVGSLTTTDPNPADAHTYSFNCTVSGADDASFQIGGAGGDVLQTAAVFDYEAKNSYAICLRTNDSNGGIYDENFSITVTDTNDPPTDIALSNSSVNENQPIGTAVGTLTTTDLNGGDTHTYSFACSTPGADDTSFQISGDSLQTNAVFDHETKDSYAICIRTDDGKGGTFDKDFTINVTDVIETITSTLRSIGAYDGWILESGENSNIGGTQNAVATTFNLGDDAADKQYRAILSFNTAGLPDNAVITKITLKIKKMGLVGTSPFTTHGGLKVFIRKPYFGASARLAVSDFQAAPSRSTPMGTFGMVPVGSWYSVILGNAGYPYLNLIGTTQFRLSFYIGDNDDMSADYMKFYSGNYSVLTDRPTLIIEFHLP